MLNIFLVKNMGETILWKWLLVLIDCFSEQKRKGRRIRGRRKFFSRVNREIGGRSERLLCAKKSNLKNPSTCLSFISFLFSGSFWGKIIWELVWHSSLFPLLLLRVIKLSGQETSFLLKFKSQKLPQPKLCLKTLKTTTICRKKALPMDFKLKLEDIQKSIFLVKMIDHFLWKNWFFKVENPFLIETLDGFQYKISLRRN